jgi:hypothetical protein
MTVIPWNRVARLLPLLLALPIVVLLVAEPHRSPSGWAQGTFRGLPLTFEANRAQTDSRVRFLARGIGHTLFLTPSEAVLVLTKPETKIVLRMRFPGASPRPRVAGLDELPGKVNYFVGRDPAHWHTNVPLYGTVQYTELYPGIDLRYSGDQRQVVCDFVVRPGADPGQVSLVWEGVDSLELDAPGNLLLHTAAGVIRQPKPHLYQDLARARREVAGRYVRHAARQVGFDAGDYDADRPLVITSIVPLYLSSETSRSTTSVR